MNLISNLSDIDNLYTARIKLFIANSDNYDELYGMFLSYEDGEYFPLLVREVLTKSYAKLIFSFEPFKSNFCLKGYIIEFYKREFSIMGEFANYSLDSYDLFLEEIPDVN